MGYAGNSSQPVSDHFPVLLEGGGLKRGPSPFNLRICEEFGLIETKKGEVLRQVVYWDEKVEIMGFFENFMKGQICKVSKCTFLVLVPKKGGAEDLKDFRPISLVGSLYKLLARCWQIESRRLKSNQGGMLCKLDIEKAYDHVSWKFLLAVLKKMGFGERWIKWIEWCISTVRFSVLINGSPSVFSKVETRRPSIPLSVCDSMEESHDQLTHLSWLLMWFEACSGLRVNLEKSELIPWGGWFGMELKRGFEKGLLCGRDSIYQKGGRLTLIRGTLSSMPVYFMSLFYLPKKARLRLEKIRKDFLWGGRALEQRPHLVRWNLVCLEKKKGGLSVRNLALLDKALLSKWNWHFAIESEALWKQVISNKYGVEEGDDAWVSDVWNPDGVGDGWTPLFSRAFNDWEIEMVERFMLKIQAFRVQREDEDKVVWITSKSGAFSVKCFILF
ncbi:putative ribonuclease H protein [Vitis vinifera]|uniref:Putative ribonuclease H protein n=1 Tax=Vitis vinifera TaxID=29760 RepID=A0A438HV10_VITVI|nr:putative ribonuclease H protein [Vitis vinifera]